MNQQQLEEKKTNSPKMLFWQAFVHVPPMSDVSQHTVVHVPPMSDVSQQCGYVATRFDTKVTNEVVTNRAVIATFLSFSRGY